jgi:hypothetical protein
MADSHARLSLLVTVFLCSATIEQAALAQRRTASASDNPPSTCPVTKPSAAPFVPPLPYPTAPFGDEFWFGTPQLWTVLPRSGVWKGLPHYTPSDPTFRQKSPWWREGYGGHASPEPNLTVTGERLDAVAPPLLTDHASSVWEEHKPDQPFMMTGLNVPTVGCWRVTGHYVGHDLSYVVWVAP